MRKEKNQLNVALLCTVFLIFIIGITGCNDSPIANIGSDTSHNSSKYAMNYAPSTTIDEAQIQFAVGITNSDANLEVISREEDFANFTTSTADITDMTSNIYVSASYAPPSSEPGTMNLHHQIYKYTPERVRYNGGNQLYYQVNGTAYSSTLTTFIQDALSRMQALDNYVTADGPLYPTQYGSVSTNSSQKSDEELLQAMSDKEIRKLWKKKGYKVKILGNRCFKLTLKVGKSHDKLYLHYIFDANSIEMNLIAVTKKYKKLSKILTKKQQGKRTVVKKFNEAMFNRGNKNVYMKIKTNNF